MKISTGVLFLAAILGELLNPPVDLCPSKTQVRADDKTLNFASTSACRNAEAVRLVADEKMLTASVEFLLLNPEERDVMVKNAHACLESMRGSLSKTIDMLDPYLFPLTVKRDMDELRNGNR